METAEHGDGATPLVYLGVRLDFMRWDKELDDGVLLNWCSGVVRGPSMLTETRRGFWSVRQGRQRQDEERRRRGGHALLSGVA